jgi:hypothetical protein
MALVITNFTDTAVSVLALTVRTGSATKQTDGTWNATAQIANGNVALNLPTRAEALDWICTQLSAN